MNEAKTVKICCENHERSESMIYMYQSLEKPCTEIAKIYGISTRQVQRLIKKHGASRTRSESYILAIKQGRMTYDHLRKNVKKHSIRKTINPKLRMMILARDNFTCQTCGAKAPDTRLQIDHKDCNVASLSTDNLWVMCIDCNQGKKERTLEDLMQLAKVLL